jgi:hypothetical protein
MDATNGDLRREALLFDLAQRAASRSLVADASSRLDVGAEDAHHVVDDEEEEDE